MAYFMSLSRQADVSAEDIGLRMWSRHLGKHIASAALRTCILTIPISFQAM
jgi:hypothetical protein